VNQRNLIREKKLDTFLTDPGNQEIISRQSSFGIGELCTPRQGWKVVEHGEHKWVINIIKNRA
jgi:hypothetical protein